MYRFANQWVNLEINVSVCKSIYDFAVQPGSAHYTTIPRPAGILVVAGAELLKLGLDVVRLFYAVFLQSKSSMCSLTHPPPSLSPYSWLGYFLMCV
jgi:hypothetical protein